MKNINRSVCRLTEEIISENKPQLKTLHYIRIKDVNVGSYVGKWTMNYRMILMCTKQLNKIFSTEIFMLLLIVPIYYTVAMSEMTENIILKKHNISASISYMPGFFSYLSISMLVIITGQQINNSWTTLKTSLTRLQVQLLKHPEVTEMQAMRDLLRLVSQEPLQVRLISTLPLGMSLLPAALSATVNYFIVVLQFDKVL
ncbi:hypothetical protein evm_008691 [Chilo suppressalis]|nr:hypothetical protein evm_008691 [Chilo suppressalis]